jgi:hypothetical protein
MFARLAIPSTGTQKAGRVLATALLLAVLTSCPRATVDDAARRGHADDIAVLSVGERAAAYAVTLRAAFDLPGTALLVDPRLLPTEGGYETTGERMTDEVTRALQATGTVLGSCVPEFVRENAAPACDARVSGYAIRFSEIFTAGDSIRLNLVAERYRPAADTLRYHSPFRMEERYTLVPAGRAWAVARKERMRL